jgi:hypothetical protein
MKSKSQLVIRSVFIVAVLVWVSATQLSSPVKAQSNAIEWSAPINLSNTPESSARPAIVSDRFGYVHVFWSEEVGGKSIYGIPKQMIHDGNTIIYTRWDGKTWTQPVDILLVPESEVATYVAATVDDAGWLHVLWTGQSDIYYSKAPAWQADSARSWSTPVSVASGNARSQWESDILSDAKGNLHIVYATGGGDPGIYHILSSDQGESWGTPTRISGLLDILEGSVSNSRICADGAGRLHIVWQTNQAEGYGQSAYYSRSTDGGTTWSVPYQLDYRDPGDYGVGFPSITCIGDSEIHIIHFGGLTSAGRYEHISTDGGVTWAQPYHILTDLEGVNGYTYLLVDSLGQKHLITTMRTRAEQQGGTFYARWMGNGWSPLDLAVPESEDTGPGAHWTVAAMRLGNEIHVLWNTNFTDKAGEIWYTRGVIPGVPQQTALPVPNSVLSQTGHALAPTPDATVMPVPIDVNRVPAVDVSETFSATLSPVATLLIIVAPVLLLIALVFFRTLRRAR